MRTSEQVYNRFLWDPTLAPHMPSTTLHHTDRVKNTLTETKLLDWRPLSAGGDIPWHRVQKFSHDTLGILWDRSTGTDRIFGAGGVEALLKDLPPPAATHFYARSFSRSGCASPKTPLEFRDHGWRPIVPSRLEAPENLRFAFWNVCIDTFNKHVNHAARFQHLIRHLSQIASTLDVIALAEVQPHFCNALLAEPWVRDNFTIPFDAIENPAALTPYGVFVLVRRNLVPSWSAYTYSFSLSKHALFVILNAPLEPLVVLPILHLTSNRGGGEATRHVQIKIVKDILKPLEHAQRIVVLGDLNARDDTPGSILALQDAWSHLQQEGGATFDPVKNSLSRLSALSLTPARLDRVLYGGAGLTPTQISLFGREAVASDDGPLWLSDHYGVRASFQLESTTNPSFTSTNPVLTYKKAVAVIPPIETWAQFQSVRRSHDTSYKRWMPHMNLLYGFVDYANEHELDDIAARIGEVAKDVSAFDVHFDGVASFEHPSSTTFYAKPDEESTHRLRKLQTNLQNCFPQCTEQSRHGIFVPHLKVANERTADRDAGDSSNSIPGYLDKFSPTSFPVDNVYIIERYSSTDFFTVKRCIPLPPKRSPNLKDLLQSVEATLRQSVIDCQDGPAALPSVSMQLVGSRGLGLATGESDVDVVCETSASQEKLTDAILRNLLCSGVAESAHIASHWSREVVIRANTLFGHSTSLDILVSSGGRAANQAISATSHIRNLLQEMSDDDREAFQLFYVECVKPWTKRRALTGSALGNLPSVAWLVFALYYWRRRERHLTGWELCKGFFATGATLDFRTTSINCHELDCVALDEKSIASIWKPCGQHENLAKSLSEKGLSNMRREFCRAANQASVSCVLEEREIWQEGRYVLVVTIGVERNCDISAVQGCLTGRLQSVVHEIEGNSSLYLTAWPQFAVCSGDDLDRLVSKSGMVLSEKHGVEAKRIHINVCISMAKGTSGTDRKLNVESSLAGIVSRLTLDLASTDPATQGVSAGAVVLREAEMVWEWYRRKRSASI